jgi:nifR3 family TIM-barrel protein
VDSHARLRDLYARRPAILAPLEDVSDAVFRRLCRARGAEICLTEFVNVEGLLRGCKNARRKIKLDEDETHTAVQIYGADAPRLAEAARVAEAANPLFIDVNCGCWVPKIAGRGAGAGWLREPMVVESVSLPVTVKTRIGYGPESHMPIVDLARRLEDAGVAALTVHCRTAQMGHSGAADWSWAARAREVVSMPVIVNGDVKSAADAERALRETGCAGVMVGRRAIEHPWVFREIRAKLDRGVDLPGPTAEERISLCLEHLAANCAARGERFGCHVTRRHLSGYLSGLPGAGAVRRRLMECETYDACAAVLTEARERSAA